LPLVVFERVFGEHLVETPAKSVIGAEDDPSVRRLTRAVGGDRLPTAGEHGLESETHRALVLR
jgi:hypothetical protein